MVKRSPSRRLGVRFRTVPRGLLKQEEGRGSSWSARRSVASRIRTRKRVVLLAELVGGFLQHRCQSVPRSFGVLIVGGI